VSVEGRKVDEGRRVRVPDSLSEYAREVLVHWPWLLVGCLALTLGLYSVVVSHVLAVRTWIWFSAGFLACSVAQFLAFHQLRRERNDMLTAPATERVSLYAVAASRGVAPPPIVAPRDYQLHALRQVLRFLRSEGFTELDTSTLDSLLKRLERDGVQLTYEPLGAYDCQAGLAHLVETGELIDRPEHHGFSYRLSLSAAPG
jgi:hypothetical protein